MKISAIASAIYNDVISGLRGFTATPTMSLEQLEDEVIEERLSVIKELSLKGIISTKDLLLSINCIEVDCKNMSKCCNIDIPLDNVLHFEIPQTINDIGTNAILYLGSVDRQIEYKVYYDLSYKYHKFRKRGSDKPFVYLETTPNDKGFYDGYIFNVPFVKYISIIGVFKDPRQLEYYNCCESDEYLDISVVSNEVKKRLTEKKIRYYRQLLAPITPNDQIPK